MPREVAFSEVAADAVDSYVEAYRSYFEGVFNDTGIWSQEQIVERYFAEAARREDEIYEEIVDRLSGDDVLGRSSVRGLTIPWRTRYLIVEWADDGARRIVTGLDIR